MKKDNTLKWFTLVELVVIIAIIWILVWAWSQVNFNKIGDANKQIIFNNLIISQFETIRNNTLLWKWIDTNIWVADSWKLAYSTTNSWEIIPSYSSGWVWTVYSWSILKAPDTYSITDINCLNISWTIIDAWVTTAEVHIQWNDFTLSWACSGTTRILELSTMLKGKSNQIQINTLNWLIEVQ